MVPYIGPILFALVGALTIAGLRWSIREEPLAYRSEYDLEQLSKSLSGRLMVLGLLIPPAYCYYGVLASIRTGSPAWWAWLIALLVQVVSVYLGLAARRRFFELTPTTQYVPPEPDATQARRVGHLLVVAFLALEINHYLLPEGGGGEALWRLIAAAGLVVLTLASLTAAGWATLWVFRHHRPTQGPGTRAHA